MTTIASRSLSCFVEEPFEARKRFFPAVEGSTAKSIEFAQRLIADGQEEAFVVMDTSIAAGQVDRWNRNLPRVSPWYAVKCQPDVYLMKTLYDKGCGFDAASIAEMKSALSLGCPTDRIIFANPCKMPSHIRFADSVGVRMMTFDNVDELRKIKQNHRSAKLVMRILGDDSSSICKFNAKFGVAVNECPALIREAKHLGCEIVGVSFHVGSGCQSADAFVGAVENARKAFDLLIKAGFSPRLLDLGGGWPGSLPSDTSVNEISFEEIAAKLRPTLDRLFNEEDVEIIAEPGRYFAHASCIAVANVTSKRVIHAEVPALEVFSSDDETDHETDTDELVHKHIDGLRYYINDGVYGTFNAVICDHRDNVVPATILKPEGSIIDDSKEFRYPCSIWGNTCDGLDKITAETMLPDIPVGSWFVFENMGAYTTSAASACFNGFDTIKKYYV